MSKARRRPQTPEKRRIAAAQALIRRCHSDPDFRKQMVALWRAQLARVESRSERRVREAKSETKSETKFETKSETKFESKFESKSERK
jgi:hypothetical protein